MKEDEPTIGECYRIFFESATNVKTDSAIIEIVGISNGRLACKVLSTNTRNMYLAPYISIEIAGLRNAYLLTAGEQYDIYTEDNPSYYKLFLNFIKNLI